MKIELNISRKILINVKDHFRDMISDLQKIESDFPKQDEATNFIAPPKMLNNIFITNWPLKCQILAFIFSQNTFYIIFVAFVSINKSSATSECSEQCSHN
jgi:hypothetical protein